VTLSSDPVAVGFVANLAKPGGNVTGVSLQSPELSGKRLELLREATGRLATIAVFYNPDDPPALNALKETLEAARQLGLQPAVFEARIPADIPSAFEKIAAAKPDALVVLTSPLMSVQSSHIAELALQTKLPTIYADPHFAKVGGLMSYGPDFDSIIARLAVYIDKIFKGTKPADLPVEQPTKFELVVNLRTAKSLGLTLPQSLRVLADEVIE